MTVGDEKDILVIGGSGFIGSTLLPRLDANANVLCGDLVKSPNENIEYEYLDVCEDFSLRRSDGIETIINLAAEHKDNVYPESKYYEVNVQGAKNVCAFASRAGVSKIIFTSSVAIYGFAPPNTSESGAPAYFNEYGRTKYLAEQVYKEWQSEAPHDRSVIIIRPTVVFGPGNRGNVYNLFAQIASKRFVMFGDGANVKSMAFVENVVDFIVHATTLNGGVQIYNYVDKPDLTMDSLVTIARQHMFGKSNRGVRLPKWLGLGIGSICDCFAALTGRSLPVSRVRVEKFLATTQFSSSVSTTGFVASKSLEEALAETIKSDFGSV